MLYVRMDQQPDICMIEIDPSVLDNNQILLTDGNAASANTEFYRNPSDLKYMPWNVLREKYWDDKPDGKRKMCAEVLVYPKVPPKYIKKIHCYSPDIINLIKGCGKRIIITSKLYF